MVNPITPTSPVERSINVDGSGSLYFFKWGTRQKPPFTEPAYVRILERRTLSADKSENVTYGGFANANVATAGPRADIYAWRSGDFETATFDALVGQARTKWIDKMSDSAESLVNLAERRQSMSMISNRALQLARFTRKIRQFDLVGAGHELGLGNPRAAKRRVERSLKVKERSKTASNLWLEYHFGWSPLISDIGNACSLLSSPIKDVPYKVSAVRRWTTVRNWGDSQTTGYGRHQSCASVRIGGSFKVTNPNLFLANRLGMLNPAGVAWELVPFSFVIDWFVNVSDFLGQWTDLAGVELIRPWYTMKWQDTCTGRETFKDIEPLPWDDSYFMTIASTSMDFVRLPRFPSGVTLGVRPPWSLSSSRAATSISLLLQRMR